MQHAEVRTRQVCVCTRDAASRISHTSFCGSRRLCLCARTSPHKYKSPPSQAWPTHGATPTTTPAFTVGVAAAQRRLRPQRRLDSPLALSIFFMMAEVGTRYMSSWFWLPAT
jgi:hypothetical protein